jgi:hypothetical protein
MCNSSEASAPHRLTPDTMISPQALESDSAALQIRSTDNPPDPVPSSGRTLLPGPVAALVSTVTGVSSLSIKVGTSVGGLWIAGAREATLTGLELTRAAVEAVLTTAGRDVSQRRNGELGRAEAASILERSVCSPRSVVTSSFTDLITLQISALHSAIASVSFFASSSFYLSAAGLDSASSLSLQGLSTLNAILGSTESSRAVAAIATLIKEELNKPGAGNEGEIVGYVDLISGIIGFVLLQRWGRRKTELDFRANGGEEVIWDTVLDDKGFRADVVGTRRRGYFDLPRAPAEAPRRGRSMSFLSPTGDEEIEALERGTINEATNIALSPHDQTRLSDEEIREYIMSQLPEGAHAVITSETITAKTIKVDIYDNPMTDVSAPPGTIMIAERFPHAETPESEGLPHQTVVFRTALKRSSSAEIEPTGKLRLTTTNHVNLDPSDSEDVVMMGGSSRYVNDKENGETEEHAVNIPVEASDPVQIETPTPPPAISSPTPVPTDRIANQKKSRIPVGLSINSTNEPKDSFSKSARKRFTSKTRMGNGEKSEKDGPLKKALKSLSPSQSSTAIKDLPKRPARALSNNTSNQNHAKKNPAIILPRMTTTPASGRTPSKSPSPQLERRNYVSLTNTDLTPIITARPTSRQSYYAVHEKRQESVLSETYSTHSIQSRPGSPTLARTHARSTSGLSKTRSNVDVAVWDGAVDERPTSALKHHQRSKSFVPSLYSMGTKGSDDALILAPKVPVRQNSIYDDHDTLDALFQDGKVPGTFPDQHMVHNVRRFARFSSASYGSNFLRVMGLTSSQPSTSTVLQAQDVHHEHHSFSTHTGLPADTILLSSFVDPQGVGSTNSSPMVISPLVHFVSIDRDSRAVVLTCRGTLGFEDVLTDMLCDYDDLYWQGQAYQVHKGIHGSARRLLAGLGSRVMATLKAALEEYPDYGLVLCGHSLGGAVASVLAILISEPSTVQASGAMFVTAPSLKLISHPNHQNSVSTAPPVTLPAGRPIHVYAYGTPATLSPPLRLATRGLITTIVNSADIVPSLSLGMLHDFRSVALSLKTDTTGAINALKTRVWQRITHALQNVFYVDRGPPPPEHIGGDGLGEDTWAWAALKTFRAGMHNQKLVPPGEIFVVETTRVFDRQTASSAAAVPDTATERVFRSLGRPATRVQLKLIRDVEARFGELRFGSSMFSDHSPGRYEASLAALEKGILEC